MSQVLIGFGVRLRNYSITALSTALILATINHHFAEQIGLKISKNLPGSFVDAFYFTVITLTTVGYGDIVPTTALGRLVIAGEAVSGFVLFAIIASMISRKILP
jgi:voltage-gated potassium channel Kch